MMKRTRTSPPCGTRYTLRHSSIRHVTTHEERSWHLLPEGGPVRVNPSPRNFAIASGLRPDDSRMGKPRAETSGCSTSATHAPCPRIAPRPRPGN